MIHHSGSCTGNLLLDKQPNCEDLSVMASGDSKDSFVEKMKALENDFKRLGQFIGRQDEDFKRKERLLHDIMTRLEGREKKLGMMLNDLQQFADPKIRLMEEKAALESESSKEVVKQRPSVSQPSGLEECTRSGANRKKVVPRFGGPGVNISRQFDFQLLAKPKTPSKIVTLCLPGIATFIKESNKMVTPAFYTHKRGYNTRVKFVSCEGEDINERALFLGIYPVAGKYDAELVWPAQCKFEVQLINKCRGKDIIFSGMSMWDAFTVDNSELWDFVEDDTLELDIVVMPMEVVAVCKNMEEEKSDEDRLGPFRVSEIEMAKHKKFDDEDPLGPFRKPPKEIVILKESEDEKFDSEDPLGSLRILSKEDKERLVECPATSFLMPNFQKLCDKSLVWKGPVVYTHYQGYQICLSVEGVTVGNGVKFVMLGLYRKRGDFDYILDWPVWYNVILTIVNKRGGQNMVFSTGDTKWEESEQDIVDMLFWAAPDRQRIRIECSELKNFVANDMIEFVIQCKRKAAAQVHT